MLNLIPQDLNQRKFTPPFFSLTLSEQQFLRKNTLFSFRNAAQKLKLMFFKRDRYTLTFFEQNSHHKTNVVLFLIKVYNKDRYYINIP